MTSNLKYTVAEAICLWTSDVPITEIINTLIRGYSLEQRELAHRSVCVCVCVWGGGGGGGGL